MSYEITALVSIEVNLNINKSTQTKLLIVKSTLLISQRPPPRGRPFVDFKLHVLRWMLKLLFSLYTLD